MGQPPGISPAAKCILSSVLFGRLSAIPLTDPLAYF
jgi:hypothetical protein